MTVDSKNCIYLMTRQNAQIIVYDRTSNFLRSWKEGVFTPRTHGIAIGPDDSVYTVDDGDHTMRKFTPKNKQLIMIDTPNQKSDTNYNNKTPSTVLRSGPPFNRPTDVALTPNGKLYVSDSYKNAQIHHFTTDDKLIQS